MQRSYMPRKKNTVGKTVRSLERGGRLPKYTNRQKTKWKSNNLNSTPSGIKVLFGLAKKKKKSLTTESVGFGT